MATGVRTQTIHLVAPDDEVIEGSEMLQGTWMVEQYLRLTYSTNRLIEFTDGHLEFLPWPTTKHQTLSGFLLIALHDYLDPRGGTVLFAPLRLQVREGKFREPDLLLLDQARFQSPSPQRLTCRGCSRAVRTTPILS